MQLLDKTIKLTDHPAICDLLIILSPMSAKRKEQILIWASKWLNLHTASQSVLDYSKLSTEDQDFLKQILCQKIAESLTENTDYDILDHKVEAKLILLNRRANND